ncbi:hypothetical protein J6590_062149 [Homalodisca vitripennis]|nr:hypothetical protein J6590_062149 [Homalodisca vitripennis]
MVGSNAKTPVGLGAISKLLVLGEKIERAAKDALHIYETLTLTYALSREIPKDELKNSPMYLEKTPLSTTWRLAGPRARIA